MTSIYDVRDPWHLTIKTLIQGTQAWLAAEEKLLNVKDSTDPKSSDYSIQSAAAIPGTSSSGPITSSMQLSMRQDGERDLQHSINEASRQFVDCLGSEYALWKSLKSLWPLLSQVNSGSGTALQSPHPLLLYVGSVLYCMYKNSEAMSKLLSHTEGLVHAQSRVQRDRPHQGDGHYAKGSTLEQSIEDIGVKIEHVIIAPSEARKNEDLQGLQIAIDANASLWYDLVGPDEHRSVWRIGDEYYQPLNKSTSLAPPGSSTNARLSQLPRLTEAERSMLYRRLETAATRSELTYAPEIVPTAHPEMKTLLGILSPPLDPRLDQATRDSRSAQHRNFILGKVFSEEQFKDLRPFFS